MAGPASARVAPIVAAALSALAWPLLLPVTLGHVTTWVDQIMDTFRDRVIDPVGPLTC